MNIANWLFQTAQSWPDRTAVLDGDRELHTYSGLVQNVCNRAAELETAFGVQSGDRVAIFAKNAPEYIEVLYACWWIGAIVVPVNAKLHPKEAEWIIENSGAKIAFTDDGDLFAANKAIQEVHLGEAT